MSDYLTAALMHETAPATDPVSGGNWLDSLSSIPGTMAAGVVSAGTEVLNIPTALASIPINLLGGDYDGKWLRTEEVFSKLDNSLGTDLEQYYYDHQDSIDMWGFVGSSLVPGFAGAKMLRVGLGTAAKLDDASPMLRAIGKFENIGPKALENAKMEIARDLSPFSYLNKEAMKVYAAGAGQGALDALAFNTAATVALHQSSYLEDKDWKELSKDILFDSVVLGAPLGAVFDIAGKGVGILGYKKAIRPYADNFANVKASALAPFVRSGDNIEAGAKIFDEKGVLRTISPGDEVLMKVNDVKLFDQRTTELRALMDEGALSLDNKALLEAEIQSFTRLRNEAYADAQMKVTESAKKLFADVEDVVDVQAIVKQLLDPANDLNKSASIVAAAKSFSRLTPDMLAGSDLSTTLKVYAKSAKEKVLFSLDELPIQGSESRLLKIRNPLNVANEADLLEALGLAGKPTKATRNEIMDKASELGHDSIIMGKDVTILPKFNKKGILQTPPPARTALIDIRDGAVVNKAARATAWDMKNVDYKNTLNNLIADEADEVLELSGSLLPIENSVIYRKAIEDFNKRKLKEATNIAELDVLADKLQAGQTVKFQGKDLSRSDALEVLADRKIELAEELLANGHSPEQVSAALFIPEESIFNLNMGSGITNINDATLQAPRYIQGTYDKSRNLNKFELEGKLEVAKKEKLVRMQADMIVAQANPELAAIPKIQMDKYSENFTAGVFSFADAKFGRAFEQSVLMASRMFGKVMQKATENRLVPLKTKLEAIKAAGIGSADHTEFVLLNSWNKIARAQGGGHSIAIQTGDGVTLMRADQFKTAKDRLTKEIQDAKGNLDEITGAAVLQYHVRTNPDSLTIPVGQPNALMQLKTGSVNDFVETHIKTDYAKLRAKNQVKNMHGQTAIKVEQTPGAFTYYDPSVNMRNYPYVLVIRGAPESSNPLYAGQSFVYAGKSADDIRNAQAWAQQEGLQTYTKGETQDFYKMLDAYDNNETFKNGAIKEAMQSKGKMTSFVGAAESFEDTSTRFLDWHLRDEGALQRSLFALKEADTIGTLKNIDLHEKRLQESRKGNPSRLAKLLQGEATRVTKPEQLMNTIFNTQNPGIVNAITKAADDFGIGFATNVRDFFSGVRAKDLDNPASAASKGLARWMDNMQVEQFVQKDIMEAIGIKNYDSPGYANFVRTSNMALVMGQLRLDAVNSLINAISMPIIGSSTVELAIRSTIGDLTRQGRLTDVDNLKKALYQKEGTLGYMPSTYVRMAKQSIGRMETLAKDHKIFGPMAQGDETLAQFMLRRNITFNPAEVAAMDLTDATLTGLKNKNTQASYYADKIQKYLGVLTKPSDAIESRLQFISADAGLQIAEAANLNADQAMLLMNTMVNKLQGNFNASMKPQIFQGITGSALGLFQSYQARLVHRLSDIITDGNKRMAVEATILQSSIFGGRSLPFFDALNASLIADSNSDNQDLYSSVYGGVDRNIANSMVYGLPSALLGINLSSRGNATPRFPSALTDIPAVNIWYKMAGQMKNTFGQAMGESDGGQLFNHALQHNVFSRPMQQLGVMLAGYSTTANNKLGIDINSAKLYNENNWLPFNVSNFMRIAGARPIDEAVMLDTVYRWQGFEKADAEKREAIGQEVSSQLLANGELNPESANKMLERYLKAGGTSKGFERFVKNQFTNTSLMAGDRLLRQIKHDGKSKQLQYMLGKPADYQTPSLSEIVPTDDPENFIQY